MTTSTESAVGRGARPARAAAYDAARADRTWAAIGVLGLASCVVVIVAVALRWRVTPSSAGHHITVLGHALSYPTANLAAVVLVCEAVLGLFVAARVVDGAAREVVAERRFGRWLRPRVVSRLGEAWVIEGTAPQAFCAGLLRPRVYISAGAVAALDARALDVVLAHELVHVRHRDPLRLAWARAITRALWFVPGIQALAGDRQLLAELRADERAVANVAGGRPALARAMLAFDEGGGSADSVGIDAARADALLGARAEWRLPILLLVLGTAGLTVIVLLALLASRVAAGSATLAPPFLSRQPCVVVLALVPSVVAALAVRGLRVVQDR